MENIKKSKVRDLSESIGLQFWAQLYFTVFANLRNVQMCHWNYVMDSQVQNLNQ